MWGNGKVGLIPSKTSLLLIKIFTIQGGKSKCHQRVIECYGDAEKGGRTSSWDGQKMHHEADRRWVDLFPLVGDQDRDLQVGGNNVVTEIENQGIHVYLWENTERERAAK